MWYEKSRADGEKQLAASAREMHSGIIWEGLGLLQWSVPDNEAALDSFRHAQTCYGITEDGLRTVLHQAEILKAENKMAQARALAAKALPKYGQFHGVTLLRGIIGLPAARERTMNLAQRYGALRPAAGSVRDEMLPAGTAPEIELQARWFSGEFGREFRTLDGRAVRVIQFGVWNREAGPDFAEAAISIEGAKPLRGAIELDVDARDWERHGHATNAAYEGVVLHLFFQSGGVAAFSRTLSNRAVPQVQLDLGAIAGPPPNPTPLAAPGRCVAPLRDLDLPTVRGVLEGAAQFRMQRKAARLARLREAHGEDEALYQALAETLGYKSNKLPFALLSQRLPVRMLRRRGEIDALLFGVAGFLKPEDFPAAAPETKAYLRALWEKWWALRAEWEGLAVPAKLWKTGGQRPVNHPQRRLAALAAMVRQWPKIRPLAEACDTKKAHQLFATLHDDYWEHHYTVRSERGEERDGAGRLQPGHRDARECLLPMGDSRSPREVG